MTSQPRTDQQLDAIEDRAAALYEFATVADPEGQAALDQLAGTDVPALIDELRQARTEIHRLRDRLWEHERPATEAERNAVRQSFMDLAAQAREDGDYEGEAVVLQRLANREEQWKAEDAAVEAHAADSDTPEHADNPAAVQALLDAAAWYEREHHTTRMFGHQVAADLRHRADEITDMLHRPPGTEAAVETHVAAGDSDDPDTGTRLCGYGADHDGHEWTSRPDVWCPGHNAGRG